MTDEDADRAEAIARVREQLSFLPGGVPGSLWSYNKDTLAEAIVDGEKRRSPAGVPLVKLGDRWYYNDPGDLLTFLKEYPGD
ncbi:MAG: hypothetical protein GWN18_04265 [Thermoplasmata archaeon]|nr:hypothetical protein [Thermoplasmata archaeon]NIS11250.1 hypothetical protein [Thermoplasmata archaeon]NIS19184.1 hypothetical protein [Thermoplasmata archaeon]NIT78079.1 hypothetical protein [Thermoplasmata archaeon]NIU48318.1 hypothetical protein [Thermoplasmata archaeon]